MIVLFVSRDLRHNGCDMNLEGILGYKLILNARCDWLARLSYSKLCLEEWDN